MKKIIKFINIAIRFITVEIWKISLQDLPKRRAFLFRQLRIVFIAFKGFKQNKCQLQASALTYYSLMSIIPIFAMMFGIAKGFGFEQRMEAFITEKLEGQPEVIDLVLQFTHSLLESTKGGIIAGLGFVVLFWSVMQLLGRIERAFNDIWEIKKSRNFMRKFSDYLTIMIIAPIFIIASSSLSFYIKSTLIKLSVEVDFVNFMSPFLFEILRFAPYVLVWLLLTLTYIIMPHTNVKFKPALMGGIIAGTLFQLMQYWYFGFQMKISAYNAIYGSFAALPLLLAWVQLSWLIILLGAEIAFAAQNVTKYEYEEESVNISNKFKKLISVLLLSRIIKGFVEGNKPLTSTELSQHFEIPIRVIRRVLNDLVESKILSEVNTDVYLERAYLPARDVHTISIHYLFEALDQNGINDIKIKNSNELKAIKSSLSQMTEFIEKSNSNILIKDI